MSVLPRISDTLSSLFEWAGQALSRSTQALNKIRSIAGAFLKRRDGAGLAEGFHSGGGQMFNIVADSLTLVVQ